MFTKIKNRIELELAGYIRGVDKTFAISRGSPVLFNALKDFISREGKRIRPFLFIISYLGFTKRSAPGIYTSAVALELLHDFMLIHDDIIDKSLTRRGAPSMHAMLNSHLRDYKDIKFSGEDLGIVAGDMLYAMALRAFLSVKEDVSRKESALKKLMESAVFTGSGEFIELLYGAKDINEVTKKDVFRIYDLKTANYSFATPLCMGAILGGASRRQADMLFQAGIYLGRAFQIRDDCLGLFGDEGKMGKPSLTDLQEAKKTILIWYAYNRSGKKDRSAVEMILSKKSVGRDDLYEMRRILSRSKTLEFAARQIGALLKNGRSLIASSKMLPRCKSSLMDYAGRILALPRL
ncbi:MAG: polyprenyl synthetase family protein [Candidatus Omnitrophica bacterium]|nr:polyprenyl synthetase family protein [Candidatus Omnitrophota bacterium]MDD5553616.1 polyprenyl synthetase family protein [Candidatus Omnitrophota bacterium]